MAEIALADDGDLSGLRELLWEIGVDFEEWGKAGPQPDAHNPSQLLISSVARAASSEYHRRISKSDGPRAVWIAVATRESLRQRQRLIQAGFDYLVRWPIHTAALRMLLMRALYRGDEQRRVQRVAVGHPASFKSGWRRRSATLVDLSPRGARLFAAVDPEPGSRIQVELPDSLVPSGGLSLAATVVRAQGAIHEAGPQDETSIAVRFEALSVDQKRRLASTLERLATGPPTLPAPAGAAPDASRQARERRGVYLQAVLAWDGDDEGCLIVGRNLSMGGMCVDEHPALEIDRSLRIALEDDPALDPIIVVARVVRAEGDRGIALRFEYIASGSEERLRALVEALPAIEELGDPADDGSVTGIVVSRVVGLGAQIGDTLSSIWKR
jgi:hypothetical protein